MFPSPPRSRRVPSPGPGSCVVVTGAASGLGRSLARAYRRAGHAVALIDRDVAGLSALEAELGGGAPDQDVTTHVLDLSDGTAAHSRMSALLPDLDEVGLVVVCAGVSAGTTIGAPDNFAATKTMIEVNTIGAIACIDAAVAHFTSRQGHGQIAVVGSIAGLRGLAGNGYGGYGASKAALRAYVQSLQAELVRDGRAGRIDVTLLLPGHFSSPMADAGDRFVIPLDRVTTDIMRAVARRKLEHVATGLVWRLQAVALRVLPLRLIARIDTGGTQ